jgi:hypothetical protein
MVNGVREESVLMMRLSAAVGYVGRNHTQPLLVLEKRTRHLRAQVPMATSVSWSWWCLSMREAVSGGTTVRSSA